MRMHLARPKPLKPLVKKSCFLSFPLGDPRGWLEPFFFSCISMLQSISLPRFLELFPENSPLISCVFEHSKTAKPKSLHPTAQRDPCEKSQCFHKNPLVYKIDKIVWFLWVCYLGYLGELANLGFAGSMFNYTPSIRCSKPWENLGFDQPKWEETQGI